MQKICIKWLRNNFFKKSFSSGLLQVQSHAFSSGLLKVQCTIYSHTLRIFRFCRCLVTGRFYRYQSYGYVDMSLAIMALSNLCDISKPHYCLGCLASPQHCNRGGCQISKWYGNLNCQSRDFKASRDRIIIHLIGCDNGSLSLSCPQVPGR